MPQPCQALKTLFYSCPFHPLSLMFLLFHLCSLSFREGDIPFRVNHSTVTQSLSLDHLGVFTLTTAHCKEKMMLWGGGQEGTESSTDLGI